MLFVREPLVILVLIKTLYMNNILCAELIRRKVMGPKQSLDMNTVTGSLSFILQSLIDGPNQRAPVH